MFFLLVYIFRIITVYKCGSISCCMCVFRRRAVWSTFCVWEFCLPSPSLPLPLSLSSYSYKEDAEGMQAIARTILCPIFTVNFSRKNEDDVPLWWWPPHRVKSRTPPHFTPPPRGPLLLYLPPSPPRIAHDKLHRARPPHSCTSTGIIQNLRTTRIIIIIHEDDQRNLALANQIRYL